MSSNSTDNLVKMANQIADFFEAMKNRDQSLAEIAGHLKRAWEPRMRHALVEHINRHNGEGLKPIVLDALKVHKLI